MAFEGYIRYGGVELVNNQRLSAYVDNLGIGGYRCNDLCPTLGDALEVLGWKGPDEVYTIPADSPHPPWYDSAEPASKGFAGIHILDWSNIDSSTYTATSQELVGDGASLQGQRYEGRQMTVRCLLFGKDLISVRHGFNWLTAVLTEGDPCFHNERRRHTYADFLPYGKAWWAIYKNTGADAAPDNVFQAVRYNGLSATDDPIDPNIPPGDFPGSGNTYAKLSHAEGDINIIDGKDVLDLLIPLQDELVLIEDEPACGGHKMQFFIQCPDEENVRDVYRMMTDVYLLAGPHILSEHEMGTDCAGGAWYEVEFTLLGSLPFVWRWPNNMLAQSSAFGYDQFLAHWLYYREETDFGADDDVYQSPLVWNEPHTYNGLIAAFFDINADQFPPPAVMADPRLVVTDSLLVLDPLCSPLVAYPPAPQEDFLCAPLYSGAYRSLRYSFVNETLPKFTPTTVRFRLISFSEEAMRDIRVRIIPPSGSEVTTSIVEFVITYLPPFSQMFIDGVRRSIDVRTGDPGDISSLVWSPAHHLVLSRGLVGSYTFPEITCGRDVTLAIDVPEIYDASFLDFDLIAVQRDA